MRKLSHAQLWSRQEGWCTTEYQNPDMVFGLEQAFDDYIDLRLQGHTPFTCIKVAFGIPDGTVDASARGYAVDRNPYVMEGLRKRLSVTQIEELWDLKKAIHALLVIVNDVDQPATAQIAAIKELNFWAGIQPVKAKQADIPSFADFYATPVDKVIQSGLH